ncbi:uncharacterized protein RBU33_000789 isoform 1-T1 [Hipposideros larvatus]
MRGGGAEGPNPEPRGSEGEDTMRRGSLHPRRGLSPQLSYAGTLTLDFWPPELHSEKAAIYKPGRQSSPEPSLPVFDLGLPAPRTVCLMSP